MVEVFILKPKSKADHNAKEDYELTALLYAPCGHKAVVAQLLQAKAEIEAKTRAGRTALHLAAANGHEGVVEVLLHANADTKAATNDGETPFQLAKWRGHTAVAEMLQQAQAVH